jgi:cytochrome P450
VTRHDVLRSLLADPRVSRNPEHWLALAQGRIPDGWPLLSVVTVRSMATVDGADHRRLRSLVSQAFTARRVADLRPAVERAVAAGLDDLEKAMEAAPPGRAVDLREIFAHPLPMTVICDLMGFPEARRDELRHISTIIATSVTTLEQQVANEQALYELLREFVAEARLHPGDNLTTALIGAATEDGDRLTDDELLGMLATLLVAGHGTTSHLIANVVRALLANPGQLDLIRSGAYDWSTAIEEGLRWDSPLGQFPMRFATEDIEIDGTVIRQGDAILASYAAVGRDDEHHGPDADEFDITRVAKQHLSFGHGVHYCLGAPLARMEAEIAVSSLFARFPGLAAGRDPAKLRPIPSIISNSVRRLPVLGS